MNIILEECLLTHKTLCLLVKKYVLKNIPGFYLQKLQNDTQ